MKRNAITISMFSSEGKKTKSFSIKVSHIKMAFFTLIGLTVISSSSFVSSYKLYKKTKIQASEKGKIINQLNALKEDSDKREAVKEKLRSIEEKLLEMQELLDKKGIKRELSVGGEFISADAESSSYFDFMEKDVNELFSVMKSFPVGTPLSGDINSGFGYRKDPFNSRLAFHSGVDIDASFGQPIVATADGIVKHAGWDNGYGQTIIIEHEHGYQTLYGHLSKVGVKEGQRVKAGETIGYTGSTGRSTGPHLHYEVIKDGKNIDPMKYLSLR